MTYLAKPGLHHDSDVFTVRDALFGAFVAIPTSIWIALRYRGRQPETDNACDRMAILWARFRGRRR